MTVMIKLRLPRHEATLDAVQKLPGLKDLTLDTGFGVVAINPREGLYVVRTDSVNDVEERRRLSPEIVEAYGDTRISTN